MTSVPVMSLGMRSGVNWMRLKPSCSACASVEMSSVFARPGTPTSSAWLRVKMAMSSSSMTSSWPTMTFASSALSSRYELRKYSTACVSSLSCKGSFGTVDIL